MNKNLKKTELLAPAGNYEIFKIAVEAGADAVYLSGKSFGARAFATNFTEAEIKEAVKYAHIRSVKVYVTVNTIVFENEFSLLEEYLDFLYKVGVDAVIVQDLGVLNLIRSKYPDFEVHASTQMNIFDGKGLDILLNLGVKRVVLARETSLDVIKKMTNKNIEIETFIHGALCFSCSGNCLMSYSIGGRSGNRGECAQPCRKKYTLLENNFKLVKNSPILSMKDLYTIENIDELIEAGIDSLKIEGRMKSPEYVYTVVRAYREAIDNYYNNKSLNNELNIKKMKIIFNRGFTKGYIKNVNNFDLVTNSYVNHQGIDIGKVVKVTPRAIEIKLFDQLSVQDAIRLEGKNDVGFVVQNMFLNDEKVKIAYQGDIVKILIAVDNSFLNAMVKKTKSSNISRELEEYMHTPKKKIPVIMNLEIKYNQPLKLTIRDDSHQIEVLGDVIQNIANNPKDDAFYIEMLDKLKDTPYVLSKAEIVNDKQGFVSIKEINALRRLAIDKLSEERSKKNRIYSKFYLNNNIIDKCDVSFEAVVHTKEQYNACKDAGIKVIYTDFSSEYMNVSRLNENKCDNSMIHNLSQIGENCTSSPYFNVINNKSIEILNHLGIKKIYLSYELSIEDVLNLDFNENLNIGYPIYGKMDVMVTKHCIISKAHNMTNKKCYKCSNNDYEMLDEYGNKFTIFCDVNNGCINRIIDYKVRNYKNSIEVLKNKGINLFLFTFTTESYDQVLNVIKEFR